MLDIFLLPKKYGLNHSTNPGIRFISTTSMNVLRLMTKSKDARLPSLLIKKLWAFENPKICVISFRQEWRLSVMLWLKLDLNINIVITMSKQLTGNIARWWVNQNNKLKEFVTLCAIWYHLQYLKTVEACNFTKSSTSK